MSRFINKRILVVDDEDLIRELFCEELVNCGAEVDSAENGEIALEKLRNARFDLILTDYRLPVCDGLKMAQTIQKTFTERPVIIMCTGYDKDISPEAAKAAGISEVIQKPFDLLKVMDIMAKFLKVA